jgi:hypothetical protein
MESNGETNMELITLQLVRHEVLALYSFLALGAHFAAIISGENSPFSLGEINNHIATLGDMTSNTLTDKLAGAVVAAQEPERHREQLPKPSAKVDEIWSNQRGGADTVGVGQTTDVTGQKAGHRSSAWGLFENLGHPINPIGKVEQLLFGLRDWGLPGYLPNLLGDLA